MQTIKKIINAITKVSIFSLIGIGLNIYLSYIFLSLWVRPQVDDVEMIFNLSVLMLFEFVLVHSGVFMSCFGRSWKGWLVFIPFYGIFALAFNTMVSGNQVLILYGAVVLNRILSRMWNSEKKAMEEELAISAVYAVLYFLLLIVVVVFCASYIPKFGLTDDFLSAVHYSRYAKGVNVVPNVSMCFGVLYYLMLTLVDTMLAIHEAKAS